MPEEITQLTVQSPSSPTALVVASDPGLSGYLCRLLSADDWSVLTASDASAAHESVSYADVVLADVRLAGVDGFDLVRDLRANPTTTTLPITLLSSDSASVVTGLLAGANDCTVMPFDPTELRARLHNQLERRRSQQAELHREQSKAAHLEYALETSRTIGAAIGIVMSTTGVTQTLAFDVLRAASQDENRKLRDIADDIVLTGAVPSR